MPLSMTRSTHSRPKDDFFGLEELPQRPEECSVREYEGKRYYMVNYMLSAPIGHSETVHFQELDPDGDRTLRFTTITATSFNPDNLSTTVSILEGVVTQDESNSLLAKGVNLDQLPIVLAERFREHVDDEVTERPSESSTRMIPSTSTSQTTNCTGTLIIQTVASGTAGSSCSYDR
ncbi:hypothetical protein BCR39DRAFT_561694 [Naematelia encephala]|uniref:Uncharacterized protein n=1 Tax=Naematelia encephala TaxID=71784 RepID=A0A1Y2AP38_9TREE|nr:hypothetical protein BCR39DRAFT_561694 [Naematelia encephala]